MDDTTTEINVESGMHLFAMEFLKTSELQSIYICLLLTIYL